MKKVYLLTVDCTTVAAYLDKDKAVEAKDKAYAKTLKKFPGRDSEFYNDMAWLDSVPLKG